MDPIAFNDDRADEVKAYIADELDAPYRAALEQTSDVIDGFESPLGMELLATVDWLLTEGGCDATVISIKEGLRKWPGGKSAGQRKLRIFPERLIEAALERVGAFSCALILGLSSTYHPI